MQGMLQKGKLSSACARLEIVCCQHPSKTGFHDMLTKRYFGSEARCVIMQIVFTRLVECFSTSPRLKVFASMVKLVGLSLVQRSSSEISLESQPYQSAINVKCII